jgi:AraC-like DNA-binding protein
MEEKEPDGLVRGGGNGLAEKKFGAYMVFFLSYAAVLLITISSLVVYYAQVTRTVSEETQQQKLTLLGQLEDNLNGKVKYADALMNSIVSDNKLSQVAKGYDSYTYGDLMADMQSAYKPDYLLNFSVYIAGTDEIVTEGVHMQAPDFFTYMYRVEGIDYKTFAREYLTGYKLRSLMPTVRIETFGKNPVTALPYIQSFPLNPNGRELGQVLVLIDTKDLTDLMAKLSDSTHSAVYILDQNGQLVLSSDGAPEPDGGLGQELRGEGESFQTGIAGEQVMVTQVASKANGWRYVLSTPKDVYFRQNAKFALSCLVIFLVYLAVGFAVVNFLARRSYRPIKEIRDIITDYRAEGDPGGKNELSAIKNTLISQFNIDRQLNAKIQEQMPVVRQAYLLSLIRGLDVDYAEAQRKLPSLGVRPVSGKFLLCVLEFDLDSPFFLESTRLAEENYTAARAVLRSVEEENTEDRTCLLLDLDRNRCLYFVNVPEQASREEAAKQFQKRMDGLTAYASAQYGLNASFGVSMVHDGLKSLPKCFDEAGKALETALKGQRYGAVYFGDVGDRDPGYYYPTDTEYLLVSLLKGGKYAESQELLNSIFVVNANLRVRGKALDALLSEVSSTLERVMSGVPSPGEKGPGAGSPADLLGSDRTLESAKTAFMEYIARIAEASGNRTLRKSELLVNNIAEFIEKNVEGNLLDLNFISRKFGLTPQYVSNIFKKYRRENVKEYISRLKLERAKKLLLTTDLPLHEISTRMGYADELGVFRLFRKYENRTPGEWRAIHKKPK